LVRGKIVGEEMNKARELPTRRYGYASTKACRSCNEIGKESAVSLLCLVKKNEEVGYGRVLGVGMGQLRSHALL